MTTTWLIVLVISTVSTVAFYWACRIAQKENRAKDLLINAFQRALSGDPHQNPEIIINGLRTPSEAKAAEILKKNYPNLPVLMETARLLRLIWKIRTCRSLLLLIREKAEEEDVSRLVKEYKKLTKDIHKDTSGNEFSGPELLGTDPAAFLPELEQLEKTGDAAEARQMITKVTSSLDELLNLVRKMQDGLDIAGKTLADMKIDPEMESLLNAVLKYFGIFSSKPKQ